MSVFELFWIVVELQSRLFRVSAELEETRREHARARARIAELEDVHREVARMETTDDGLRARLRAVLGAMSDDELLRWVESAADSLLAGAE